MDFYQKLWLSITTYINKSYICRELNVHLASSI